MARSDREGETGGRGSATSYMIVNRYERKAPGAEARPSVPPMVARVEEQRGESEEALEEERFTADLTDTARALDAAREGMLPEDLFFCLYSQLHQQFRREMSRDPDFLRVKYFVPSPPRERSTFGPFCPIYNEPFPQVSWQELEGAILELALQDRRDEGPRGIHFVHEQGDVDSQDEQTPPYMLDISLDGRGSILEMTARIELWWSFSIVHRGAAYTETSLRYASGLMLDYVRCLVRFCETLGYPISRDCALVDFFYLMDSLRTADPENHEVDVESIPLGQPLYEFNGKATFAGREMEVTVDDSTGFVHRTARTLVDESRRVSCPLKGFSVGIRGDLNTVRFQRRFADQRRDRTPPG